MRYEYGTSTCVRVVGRSHFILSGLLLCRHCFFLKLIDDEREHACMHDDEKRKWPEERATHLLLALIGLLVLAIIHGQGVHARTSTRTLEE